MDHRVSRRTARASSFAVFFTGKNHPTEKPRAEVIMPNGQTRLATKAEVGEVSRVLGEDARAYAA